MSNYYKSKCCGEQVTPKETIPGIKWNYVCLGCHQKCEVTAMIDTPGGVPKEESHFNECPMNETFGNKDKPCTCMPPTLTQLKDEMEKEYAEQFPCKHHPSQCDGDCKGEEVFFISSHLQKAYEAKGEEIKKMIDSLRKEFDPDTQDTRRMNAMSDSTGVDGYNLALDDLLTSLTSSEEQKK